MLRAWRVLEGRILTTLRRYASETEAEAAGKEIQVAASSLRVDAIAAAGLDISRKKIWEYCLDGRVTLNGKPLQKKSINVQEGDVIEVDSDLKTRDEEGRETNLVKRGRVVVKEIGSPTRKGGSHLILLRFKHFQLFKN